MEISAMIRGEFEAKNVGGSAFSKQIDRILKSFDKNITKPLEQFTGPDGGG